MKSQKIIYAIATGLFCLWMSKNAYAYLTTEEAKQLCMHFGLPDYLRIELAVFKIIGVLVLVLPVRRGYLKEWAYAGFSITMISGFIAHLASGDSLLSALSALVGLALLLTSYFSFHQINKC